MRRDKSLLLVGVDELAERRQDRKFAYKSELQIIY